MTRKRLKKKVADLEECLKKEDYSGMKELSEDIKKDLMEVGKQAYSQTDGSQPNTNGEDVIETDFSTEK